MELVKGFIFDRGLQTLEGRVSHVYLVSCILVTDKPLAETAAQGREYCDFWVPSLRGWYCDECSSYLDDGVDVGISLATWLKRN